MKTKRKKNNRNSIKNQKKRDNAFLIIGFILLIIGIILFIFSMTLLKYELFAISSLLIAVGIIVIIISYFHKAFSGWRMFYKSRPKWQDSY